MTERFTTNGYYIYDHFKEDSWLVNEVEAQEIIDIMNNLDTKARERSKALSKLQKENEQLKETNQELFDDLLEKTSWLSLRGGEISILKKENERLWREIRILIKQGAEPSDAFKEYLDSTNEYNKFWQRKLQQAKDDGVI